MFGSPELHRIVVGVDYVEIRHGSKAPLDPAVDVEVVPLGIVLHKSGPEQTPGEIDFYAWTDQEEIVGPIGSRKFQIILLKIH